MERVARLAWEQRSLVKSTSQHDRPVASFLLKGGPLD